MIAARRALKSSVPSEAQGFCPTGITSSCVGVNLFPGRAQRSGRALSSWETLQP